MLNELIKWCASGLGIACVWLLLAASGLAQTSRSLESDVERRATISPPNPIPPNPISPNPSSTPVALEGVVTSVSQLEDIRPTDWAFQALQSLVERYGCIVGYPDQTFRGNRALSRYEFAAGLNACLDKIQELIGSATADSISQADLELVKRLQAEFASELSVLRGRVETLEVRTATLEKQQFSTVTRLTGQVIMGVNAGGFTGDRIFGASGNELTSTQPNATTFYRAALFLSTSFNGSDLLQILLDVGSNGGNDNAAGFLEPSFGSGLDYSVKPPSNGNFGLSRAFYTFKPTQDLVVSIGPNIRLSDYIDRNSYANFSFRDFSTLAFVNNFILLPVFGPSAGAAITWKPGNGAFTVKAAYGAAGAEIPGNRVSLPTLSSFSYVLYPDRLSRGGLFGDNYQGFAELEYAPSKTFALRLQYAGGRLSGDSFNGVGVNLEWTVASQIGIFGRYGYSWYSDTAYGDVNPQYWMAGVAVRDLFKRGATAGLAAGQPLIEREIGTATQTNFEAFYTFPINDNIQVSPIFQVITNAGNQDANGTIFSGTLRTVFSF